MDGSYTPSMWGDCGQGDYIFHPSASAVQCQPDLLSCSGYHAPSLFEASQDILSLRKDTFGMSVVGIYCSWPTGSLTEQLYLKYSNQPAKANKIP